jgi:hypothetical protein
MGAKTVLWCREKFPFMALWLVFLTIPLAISLTKICSHNFFACFYGLDIGENYGQIFLF